MFELSSLGFDSFFEAQLSDGFADGLSPARVASEHRESYEVWSRDGSGSAHLAGRLHRELDKVMLPRVGDWVALTSVPGTDHIAIIERVFKRRTVFMRGAAGPQTQGQVIAANIDLVFVVCGLDADYNPHRIERYIARIWASGAQPAIVLNKTDLCAATEACTIEIEARCPGVPVYTTSAIQTEGISEIRTTILPGLTAAFVGSSGAGKSSLINALLGEERMATAAVRAQDSRGRHTTTRRQLILLPGAGILLDTPGMREMQLMDEEGIGAVFADIELLAGNCRYRDCHHDSEPGCAVIEAVTNGTLSAERFEHFHKLEREAHAYEVRHDALLRRKAERVWKGLKSEGVEIRRRKEGR